MTMRPEDAGGIVAHWAGEPGTQVWQAHGLLCAVTRSPMFGMNGYVRLPAGCAVDVDRLTAPGGITWGPDEAGWVGFDTGHGFDAWLDPEVQPFELERQLAEVAPEAAERMAELRMQMVGSYGGVVWTLERLREKVEALAGRVAELAGVRDPARQAAVRKRSGDATPPITD